MRQIILWAVMDTKTSRKIFKNNSIHLRNTSNDSNIR